MASESESISLVLEKARQTMEREYEISSFKIQRVPPLFQEGDKYAKYCKPKVISIGPIHHDDPKLKRGEQYKLMWTSMFVEQNGQKPENLHKRVLDKIADLRKLFSWDELGIEYNDEDLAFMLLVDGCSIIQILVKGNLSRPHELKIKEQITYRTIRELKASAFQIKRKENGLMSFSFSWSRGFFFNTTILSLPPLILDDSTIPILLNLIAYEMCPDFENTFMISSLIKFFDLLIDHPEDAKELRKDGILQSSLGSDEEVSEFFNTIGSGLVQNHSLFSSMKSAMEWHYKDKFRIWMAEAYYTHCKSPWTIIALLAATILLILTFIQTINSF